MARHAIRSAYLTDETKLVRQLIDDAELSVQDRTTISAQAAELVRRVRSEGQIGTMEAFLAEYGLSTEEGVALMCLAEAMLRVPDAHTVDELIRDKISPHDWAAHVGDSGSILVNASTWGLLLTGRILDEESPGVVGTLHALVRRLGEPVIRRAVGQAMAEMGAQFVLGRTIEEAMSRGQSMVDKGYTYSFDMLGEAACTDADALRYHAAYSDAIASIANAADSDDIRDNPGISVKLSALHPRYEQGQREHMLPVLRERLLTLARAAKDARIGFNIDAEEADRLDLSLDVIQAVLADPSLAGWDGFGIVVQAFGRRAMPTLDYLHDMAQSLNRRIMVRLVKGAYWDTEIKRAQVMGLSDYPVFTRKSHTDVSYLAGARKLLGMTDHVFPQFATHNAHSAAAILHMAGNHRRSFEFQRLHGMGDALHDIVKTSDDTRCRIYAPVGAHKDLLAYLVRRLLENGANSSFVNQIVDTSVPAEDIATDPVSQAEATGCQPNPAIVRPADLFAPRANSQGFDITDPVTLAEIETARSAFAAPYQWQAVAPGSTKDPRQILNPADPADVVGTVTEATPDLVDAVIGKGCNAQPDWDRAGSAHRAAVLRKAADLYEANAPEIFALTSREAGKTLLDGVAELREAVDFLRFYADEAEKLGTADSPRGVIVCISPWNFPLAIFTGQIAAALAAGNAVVAKPAEQTPLIAARAVAWLHQAGVPADVLQLLFGDGPDVGAPLSADPRIGGLCFTGSTEVAKLIDRQLAQTAPEAMLIAETGGMNAMIVDSTALLEQATRDIVRGAFQSAGQRCSALRVLYVQKDIEDDLMQMLFGAMDALVTGDPWDLATDVAPVIDKDAQDAIRADIETARAQGRVLKSLDVPQHGLYIPATVIRVTGIQDVKREIFGPVLHIASFDGEDIDAVVQAINTTGYGLTFGLHTRIDSRVQEVIDAVHVGNVYVNRDQIGAVVGSQPFGGHGLSGTGPKAGGPHYLPRFRRTPMPKRPAVPAAADISLADVTDHLQNLTFDPDTTHAQRISSIRAALRGKAAPAVAAAAALDIGPLDLPGPTGEANQLTLTPKGLVLCLGPDPDSLLAQCVQALAFGNRVLAVAPVAPTILRPLLRTTLPIVAVDGTATEDLLSTLSLDLVASAVTGGDLDALRQTIAKRPGPIIRLETRPIAPTTYVNESAICIDTTAAGGNASLLASAEP